MSSSVPGEGRIGVLVMAYGTPASPADIELYYTHIRRGRPPSAEQVTELTGRYAAIGGISPLAARTEAQRAAIAAQLERIEPGRYVVRLGNKHAAPFVEDGVAQLAADAVTRIVGLVLAPHYSAFSVGEYHRRSTAAASEQGIAFVGIDEWWDLAAFADHQAGALRAVLADTPSVTKVVFTAHSLPERVLEGDPYPDQLHRSAASIAARAGLDSWVDWATAWQSAGRTPEPWRGPDIAQVIADLADTGRAAGIVVVPHGFTSDHLEVLYDLDVVAAQVAREHGLRFARTAVVNDDPAVMAALAGRVAEVAGR